MDDTETDYTADVVILETWGIIDKWWTDDPVRDDYVDAYFMGRRNTFKKSKDETIWRIVADVGVH